MAVVDVQQPRHIAGFHKYVIIFLVRLHHCAYQLAPLYTLSRLQKDGSCHILNLFRKLLHIGVNSHACNHVIDAFQLGAHLGENAADFLSVRHNVIRPLNLSLQAAGFPNSFRYGQGCHQSQHGSGGRMNLRSDHQAHPDAHATG